MVISIQGRRMYLWRAVDSDAIEVRLAANIGQVARGQRKSGDKETQSVIGIMQGMAICDVALAHAALVRAAPDRPDIVL